jgi:hypothetical protein
VRGLLLLLLLMMMMPSLQLLVTDIDTRGLVINVNAAVQLIVTIQWWAIRSPRQNQARESRVPNS